jgi:hypothetical protein
MKTAWPAPSLFLIEKPSDQPKSKYDRTPRNEQDFMAPTPLGVSAESYRGPMGHDPNQRSAFGPFPLGGAMANFSG